MESLKTTGQGNRQTTLDGQVYRPALNVIVDILSRLLPSAFFLAAVLGKIADLRSFLNRPIAHGVTDLEFYVSVASRVSVILFLALMASLFVVRAKPVSKASGASPRIMAIVGTFLMSAVTIFPRAELGMTQTMTATLLVVIGTTLSTYVLFRLGRSFSLNAEARRLVTSGPYAIVRHPLYLAEEIAVIGAFLHYISPATFLIFAVHLWIQIKRMKNEEAVLLKTFPAYAQYQASTPRLIPGLY